MAKGPSYEAVSQSQVEEVIVESGGAQHHRTKNDTVDKNKNDKNDVKNDDMNDSKTEVTVLALNGDNDDDINNNNNNFTDTTTSTTGTTATGNVMSIDHAIDLLGMGKFQVLVLIASGLCFAADAMQVMLLSFLTLVLEDEWELTKQQTALITSIIFLGALLGTLILGPAADMYGRRPIFLVAAADITLAGFATACAPHYTATVASIFMVGFGVGGLTVPFDILAEFLPAARRGKNLLLIEYFWTVGCLYVVVVAYCTLQGDQPAWRIFVGLCAVPCLVSWCIGYFFVPESARWLITQPGRQAETLSILRKAATMNGHDADFLFPPDCAIAEEPAEKHGNFADLFQPQWIDITLRLWGAWAAFAFGYYGTIMVTTKVFDGTSPSETAESKGHEEDFDYGAIFLSSAAELVGTSIVIVAVDRFGRIPSQMVAYSMAGIAVCMLCVLAGAAEQPTLFQLPTGFNVRWTLIALGFIARVFEMAGTCVTWVSTAEVLTTDVRGTGHSTANAMARLGGFFCPFLIEGRVPLLQTGFIMLVVHFFTVFCVAKLPETKGRGMGGAQERTSSGGPTTTSSQRHGQHEQVPPLEGDFVNPLESPDEEFVAVTQTVEPHNEK